MAQVTMFTVRPVSRPAKPEHTFRIHISAPALIFLKLRAGDLCQLQADGGVVRYALAHPSTEKIQDSIVQTSKALQELYGFKLGDKINVSRTEKTYQSMSTATLVDVTVDAPALSDRETIFWELYAENTFPANHEALLESQILTVETAVGNRRSFCVDAVGTDTSCPLVHVSRDTKFTIIRTRQKPKTLTIPSSSVGGLQAQLEQLQNVICRLTQQKSRPLPSYCQPSQGVIIYGAKGTGKTLLIRQVAESGWKKVVRWHCRKPVPSISPSDQPCLIIVEGLAKVGASLSSNDDNYQSTTLTQSLFEAVSDLQVLIIVESRHPNSIHESLRAEGLFEEEMELPIPSEMERLQILQAICGDDDRPHDDWLREAAKKSHGYVGSDLRGLLRTAVKVSEARTGVLLSDREADSQSPQFDQGDLHKALSLIRPSALQEVFLEKPDVHWSNIGGQKDIKQRLQNAIEWPLKKAEMMKALNLNPKKGILLYGPPGCSKTLLVKALATEAELNFLAVKGAELISQYVGESERAVREVFRKARAAAPSILFFDEIDSIASRGRTELNVLTTLLNEMDGFEELRGVFVVAATNKPMAVDAALMRPGRFDNVVYVGPPDFETREEILKTWCEKSQVEADPIQLAKETDGFSGAEIVGICQTAGEYALSADREKITSDDFTSAISRTPKGITRDMLHEFERWKMSRT